MDFNEKRIQLKAKEQALESQIERIWEAKEELNLQETKYKKELYFIRGQLELLETLIETPKTATVRTYVSPPNDDNLTVVSDQILEPVDFTEQKKTTQTAPIVSAQITGMDFF